MNMTMMMIIITFIKDANDIVIIITIIAVILWFQS